MNSEFLNEPFTKNFSRTSTMKKKLLEEKKPTAHQLEVLYMLGFEFYKSENFQKAADIFRLLCFYEPEKSRNWMALGGANQNSKNYRTAAAAFLMAALEDPLNPEPRLYLAHSFIDMMNLSAARDAVEQALELCTLSNNQQKLQLKAQSLLRALESISQE